MSIIDTKIGRLAVLLLPTALRGPVITALVTWLVQPISVVLSALAEWRRDTIARLGYNGQLCNMERCLNDLLDPGSRGIRVVDGQQRTGKPYYIYRRGTDYNDMPQERGASPGIVLDARESMTRTYYDFEVDVPSRVLGEDDNERRLHTLVNRYKLPSKRWRMTTNY